MSDSDNDFCDLSNSLPNGKESVDSLISDSSKMLKNKEKLDKFEELAKSLKIQDIKDLKKQASTKWGLLNDNIRQIVWPLLVDITECEAVAKPSTEEIENHHYYGQVVMDVNRSLKRFPPSIDEDRKLAMLDELVLLIMRILIKHPKLHYYQGFHDICVTFLLVLGEELSYLVLEKLAQTHFKMFMEETMEQTVDILSNIYIILDHVDPGLKEFMEKSEVGVMFGLSWLITWFGHVLNHYEDVVRLFDLFIVSHPWFPLYLVTAIVTHRSKEILNTDCDMASVHSLLNTLPSDLNIEELILRANELFEECPPSFLKSEQLKLVNKTGKKISHRWYFHKNKNQAINSLFSYFPIPSINRWTLFITVAVGVAMTAYFYNKYTK